MSINVILQFPLMLPRSLDKVLHQSQKRLNFWLNTLAASSVFSSLILICDLISLLNPRLDNQHILWLFKSACLIYLDIDKQTTADKSKALSKPPSKA